MHETTKDSKSQGNLEKEDKAVGITLPDFNVCYKLKSNRNCGIGIQTDM